MQDEIYKSRLASIRRVGRLREVSNKVQNADLKMFLEVQRGLDLHCIPPPDKTKDDILLFFKCYDPEKEELRYVGRLFMKAASKPVDILTKLNEMACYSPDEEIELYEEIKFEPNVMCELIDKKLTFRSSQLEGGDILCLQKSPPVESSDQFRYPDVPSFLEYVQNRQVVIHTVNTASTIGDVINDLKTKVELSHPNSELRLLEVFYHKIYKVLASS